MKIKKIGGELNLKYLREDILREMHLFKFNVTTKGYKYLIDTIEICIKDENAIENLEKNVFSILAEKYKLDKKDKVKWCINQVFETMLKNTDMKIITEYFNISEKEKLSVKNFIYTVVYKYLKMISA